MSSANRLGQLSKTIDWLLIIAVLLLLGAGIAVIFSLTHGTSSRLYISQIIFAILGCAAAFLLTFIDYRTWKSMSWVMYFIAVCALMAVLVVGSHVYGATRWIDFRFFQFQPSELMKLILVITLARYLAEQTSIGFKQGLVVLCLGGLPIILTLRQPDLGSASVLLVVSLVMLLAARIPKIIIGSTIVLVIIVLAVGFKFMAPYQRQRIEVFLNPNLDPAGTGYNITQSKIAIGSGGIFGRGLGQGSQSQLQFLPVAHTDFIFAGTAEALGFVGSVTMLLLLALVIYRAYIIAQLSQDRFGMYLALGIATLFLYQTFINVGGNLGLVPITGIPLPFVSSGGTAIIMALISVGLLQSIYLRHKKIRFG